MSEYLDKSYWIAVAHLPRWSTERINRLIIHVIHELKLSWAEFFALTQPDWKALYSFSDREIADLENARADMPRLAFIAEQLQNEGFHLIPINSPDYPVVLKENLKIKSAPPVLYLKGKKGLLNEDAVAIVGSRNAGENALQFTDHVAGKCVAESKVVVSGFAKGVDKQALDSTLEVHGKSIIVLPQGILTFQSGFKKYYEPIVNGDLLVLSTFFPKAGWEVGLAMARNAYIYGLAKEIYVAETDSKGGTWEGALDGLKRGRGVYVRYPDSFENNANRKLIELGAIAVNREGEKMDSIISTASSFSEQAQPGELNESEERNIEKEILEFLNNGAFTTREILIGLKLNWESKKLTSFLKKNSNIKSIAGKPTKFTRNDITVPTLFG